MRPNQENLENGGSVSLQSPDGSAMARAEPTFQTHHPFNGGRGGCRSVSATGSNGGRQAT